MRVSSNTFPVIVRPSFFSSLEDLRLRAHSDNYQGHRERPYTLPNSLAYPSHHWAFERLLSASLVPLTAAAFVTPGSSCPILDGVLGLSLVMHSHLGVCSLAPVETPNRY
jgi:hypothetical protein